MTRAKNAGTAVHILADENIPAVEHYAGASATVSRFSGRELGTEQLSGVDVLLVRSVTSVNEELLEGSKLRFVGTATSGIDHIDRDYLQQRGIGFSYLSSRNTSRPKQTGSSMWPPPGQSSCWW